MDGSGADFAHSTSSSDKRREKAVTLARFVWNRGITSDELRDMTDEQRRKLARAAAVNPPSTSETWEATAELIDRKNQWALAHPGHPKAKPEDLDEKIMWVKPPVKPWIEGRGGPS